jgi:peptidylprolyl isomerase
MGDYYPNSSEEEPLTMRTMTLKFSILAFAAAMLLVMSQAVLAAEVAAPADVAAAPEGAEVTESGLASVVLQEGTGEVHPGPTSKVEVHYSGWTTDGKMFDSSVTRDKTSSFPLNGVIAGWTEGLQLMVVGEKRRFWIPEALAYGGKPGRPAGVLVFDVELISIP